MGSLLLIGVFAIWISLGSALRDVYFVNVPSVFGDQNDRDTQEYYSEACRNCSLSGNGMFYSHENACNMYIYCIPFGRSWLVFGYVAPRGALFNEQRLHLDSIFRGRNRVPNRDSCPRVGHPCDTGKMMPVDGNACHGYQQCINNRMVSSQCSNRYTGFNARTQRCDLPCNRRRRTLRFQRCDHNPTSRDYYYNYQTVRYSDESRDRVEFFNLRCTLGYKHLNRTACQCQPVNATEKPCDTMTLVYLDSRDDSWRLARNNTPMMDASSLTGNASIVNNRQTNYRFAPVFTGNRVLSAPKIRGNDLGLFFDLNFTFQAFRANQVSPGLTLGFGSSSNREFALADNSACDIAATYGCSLQARTDDIGRIICYVKPEAVPDHPNNMAITSGILDLRREIRVYFAKNDTTGILSITENGSERITQLTFPKGIRAVGNACPLSIGAGTRKRYFTGVFYDLTIKKYCGPFL